MATASAEKLVEREHDQARSAPEIPPREFHWTVDPYYRAWEAGVFEPDARLELIHGRIVEKMPPSPLQISLSNIIADILKTALPALTVRLEAAVRIEFDGEPIPDVTVVRGTNHDYLTRHPAPAEVALLIEVALSSADYDLGGKALLYAQAGIADYWVVLPNENALVVHREPTPSGYGQIARLGEDDFVTPLAASDVSLSVRSLLGR